MKPHYPPGPKSISPLGIAAQFRRDPLGLVMIMLHAYGDFVTLPGLFYQPGFLLNNPDLLHEVLVKQADKFQKPPILKKLFRSSFGNGLFFSEGDFWKRQRRLAQPAFHHKRIQAYAAGMINFTENMLNAWQDGQWRHIDEDMRDLTLRIVVDTLFQAKVTAAADGIRTAMAELGAAISPRFAYFPFGGGPRICIGNNFAMMEARLVLATIAQRYRLQLPPGHQVEANPLATLGCKGSVPMQVTAR